MSEIKCGCGELQNEAVVKKTSIHYQQTTVPWTIVDWAKCALAHAVKQLEEARTAANGLKQCCEEQRAARERAEAALRDCQIYSHRIQDALHHAAYRDHKDTGACDGCHLVAVMLDSSPPPAPSPAGERCANELACENGIGTFECCDPCNAWRALRAAEEAFDGK